MAKWIAGVALVFACSAQAQTLVTLQDQQYTTKLSYDASNGGVLVDAASQTASGQAPLNSYLQGPLTGTYGIYAAAQASSFAVSTATAAYPDRDYSTVTNSHARADAETQLSFRTLQDTNAPLQFALSGGGSAFFSSGFFSLYDDTIDAYVFSYSWLRGGGSVGVPSYAPLGSTPITWPGEGPSLSILLNPTLYSSHLYELTLHAHTDANTDRQYMNLSVAGLVPIAAPVPEPSGLALSIAGLVSVGLLARSRRNLKGRRQA